MRATILESLETPPRSADVPVPAVRANEYLVRIVAASLNPFDWKIAGGAMSRNFEYDFPVTLGRDFAGVIAQAGGDADGFSVGDAVFGCTTGTRLRHGSLAEYVPTGATCFALKPKGLDFVTAAQLPLTGTLAVRCLEPLGSLSGKSLLIVGATGGVGSLAVQLAVAAGATVVAPGLPDDSEYLTGLGVTVVIDRTGDLDTQVREHFPGGVDAAVDLVNRGDAFVQTARLVMAGGTALSAHRQADAETLAVFDVKAANSRGEPDVALLTELGELAAAGKLHVNLSGAYPLERAAEGLAFIRDNHVRGKYAVLVSDAG